MKSSILHIEGYHLKELSIELNEGFAKKAVFGAWSGYHYHPDETYKVDPVNFKVGSEIAKKNDDPFSLRYVLHIRSTGNKNKVPYSFRLALVGYFHVDKSVAEKDEKRANMMLYANASALLYAAARELLATATARGPYPAVILPSVSFMDDAEKLAEEEDVRELPSPKRKALTAAKKRQSPRKKVSAKK
jgi:preprotein translocase subunit SecB